MGSSTPQGRAALALACFTLLPSGLSDTVGSLHHTISELNTQPTDAPVQRFKCSLTTALAWLGARAVRYSFPVRLFHSLLHAGLSRRYPDTEKALAHLVWGMVRSDSHKLGLGRYLLLFRLREITKAGGVQTVHLDTPQHSAKFYEKQGFKVIGSELDRVEMMMKLVVCP